MPVIEIGTLLALRSERPERTANGVFFVQEYEGSEALVKAVAYAQPRGVLWSTDDSRAPLWRLVIRTPDWLTGDLSEEWTWEIIGEEAQQDIFNHPRSLFIASTDEGKEEIRLIKQAIEDKEDYQPTNVIQAPSPPYNSVELYNLALKGQDSWADARYTLRLTRTVGFNYSRDISDDGAFKLYTAAQIVGETSDFPMPNRTLARVQALEATYPIYTRFGLPADTDLYMWSWLKGPTSEIQIAGFKIRLTTEWRLAQWSKFNYVVKA